MSGKQDHFLPRHYLRQFGYRRTQQIVIATINPCRVIGLGPISGQCQKDYFYEKDEALNRILWQTENDLAPVLARVTENLDFDSKERVALNLLAATLHLRTKSAVEQAKIFPRRIAHEFITSQIQAGKLPEPRGGWREEMMDFTGVPGTLIKQRVIPCWMEMQTLDCKLLRAPTDSFFITSDHPVVILNQFAIGAHPLRSFVGFAQSGFQLLLPLSPNICAFSYDAKVYKVGQRRSRLTDICPSDVEVVNSLEIQSADSCVYFHDPELGENVKYLIETYKGLRRPLKETLKTYTGRNVNEEFLHMKSRSLHVPKGWEFCRLRRRISAMPGDRRNPAWTQVIEQLSDDLHKNPGGEGVFQRLKKLGFYDGPVD